jgi:hypothetical protein
LRQVFGERAHASAKPGLTAQIRSAHRSTQLAYQAALFREAEHTLRHS